MPKVTKKKRTVDPYIKLLTKEQRKKWRQIQTELNEEEEVPDTEGDDRFWEQKERELQNKRASQHRSILPSTWNSDLFNPNRGGAVPVRGHPKHNPLTSEIQSIIPHLERELAAVDATIRRVQQGPSMTISEKEFKQLQRRQQSLVDRLESFYELNRHVQEQDRRRGGALPGEAAAALLKYRKDNGMVSEHELTPEEQAYIVENQNIVKGQKEAFKMPWRNGDVLLQGKFGNLSDMSPAEKKAFALALTTMRNGQKEWFNKQNNRSFLETLKEDWLPLITKNQTISNVAKLAAKLVKDLPEGGAEASAALEAIGDKTDTGMPWLQSIGVTNEGDNTRVPLLGWGVHRRKRRHVKLISRSRKH
jgi:hypothetical protein